MADIILDFSSVTMPAYGPYDKTRPEVNRENLAYVALQFLDILRQQTFAITFSENQTVTGDVGALLAEIRDNIADLKFNGQQVTYMTKDAKITIDYLGQYITGG